MGLGEVYCLGVGEYNLEKAIVAHIQKFEKKYNPICCCVAWRNFGSPVTHETKPFIHFHPGTWSCFGSSLVKDKDCVTHTQGSVQKQGLKPTFWIPETHVFGLV